MIESKLAIQTSTGSVEIKSLFLIDDNLGSILTHNIKLMEKKLLLQVPMVISDVMFLIVGPGINNQSTEGAGGLGIIRGNKVGESD